MQANVWTQFQLCALTLWGCVKARQSIISYLGCQERESNTHKLPLNPFALNGKYNIYAEQLPTKCVQFIYSTADTNLEELFNPTKKLLHKLKLTVIKTVYKGQIRSALQHSTFPQKYRS